ncbi:MAG: nickel-dependent hydrogenase large subunit, partial [Chthoniobacterales bacterium]|nr:nickel-dependent hydrogenase large subunit [Chthoniobacterales bacterium]
MSKILDIDPVTRIEGHLAVRVQIENGVVTDAFCSGEMFRGFEEILRGRHPLDAQQITQRICGVCPIEHGVASALAQDDAYRITPARNGVLERNIVQAANYLHSHIIHFYGLCGVDFLDVTAILDYKGNDGGMQQLRDWVQKQIDSKVYLPAAPFLPRYDANYLADKALNIELLKHYTEGLEIRRLCHELGALYGGKFPHMASIVPGGMSQTIDAGIITYSNGLMKKIKDFVVNKYVPDVVPVPGAFPQYWKTGGGRHNFLAYGVFPEPGTGKHLLPPGAIINDKFSPLDSSRITED